MRDEGRTRELAQSVTTAWAMSRHGASLSAVPTSAFTELERLIAVALAARQEPPRMDALRRFADDLALRIFAGPLNRPPLSLDPVTDEDVERLQESVADFIYRHVAALVTRSLARRPPAPPADEGEPK